MDGFGVGRRTAGTGETRTANRSWWDEEAVAYYAEHGDFLGDSELVWGPEGLTESELGLLGPLAGRDVLEIGAGAAQGGRYVAAQHARVVATDLSAGMLRQGALIDERSGRRLPLAQCDAMALPFADASFDVAFTAYGAVPFVADSGAIMREAARVLRPGGRFVFSTTHPIRWAFPDAPGPEGLVADRSYFDRTPYVEEGDDGTATYVEHHRTLGDRIREIAASGLSLVDLVEPEWPDRNAQVWGGWSPTRGRVIPGTAIFVARKPRHD
nr:class I SAM-dependent methyltransferase [Flexivirga endophytica]